MYTSQAKTIIENHGISSIILESRYYMPNYFDLLNAVKANSHLFPNQSYTKCILLEKYNGNTFLHADSSIIYRNDTEYKIYFMFLSNTSYDTIRYFYDKRMEIFSPKYLDRSGSLKLPLATNIGCLELAIYTLQKLDIYNGFIINGKPNCSIQDIRHGDGYTTEELCKLSQSESYLKMNGIDIKKLKVLNTNNQSSTLREYRNDYTIGKRNKLLPITSTPHRVSFERQNSLEDVNIAISNITKDDNRKPLLEKIKVNLEKRNSQNSQMEHSSL